MNMKQLRDAIIEAIDKTIAHISRKTYWEDVISFSLYSDESYMSLALLFNTKSHFDDVKDEAYPLTYKFSPAEWFSETIFDDDFVNNNEAFASISSQLSQESINSGDFTLHKNTVEESCKLALLHCIENGVFKKADDTIYLFMISDEYDEDEILRVNTLFNSDANNKLLKEWVDNEL